MYTHIHIYVCVCIYIYIYIYVMRAYIHMYAYIGYCNYYIELYDIVLYYAVLLYCIILYYIVSYHIILQSASLSNTDKQRLDAFQNKGLRKILGIKHAYFPRIRYQQVIATANQETKPKKHKEIIKMSNNLNKDKSPCSHTYSEPQKMMK